MKQTERRDKGIAYYSDSEVVDELRRGRVVMQRLNSLDASDFEQISATLHELFGKCGSAPLVNLPFYCDYGFHIEVGDNFYAGVNCTIIDVAPVRIGNNCLIAPNVAIYTAGHPVHPDTRTSGYEYGREVTIGDDVWIGGNCVICPGVTIGNGAVIGAGSVVTKDIPEMCIAVGNPCRVVRRITDADRRKLFHDEEIDEEAWEDIVQKGHGGV